MARIVRRLTLALAVTVVLLGTGRVTAQSVVTYYAPPVVYAPAPVVSYYAPAPPVSYSYGVSVSYPAPAVSYYAAPAAVTTTRYGLFGRPRARTTYYAPGYVVP